VSLLLVNSLSSSSLSGQSRPTCAADHCGYASSAYFLTASVVTADEVPRLYSTYSPIAARPDRAAVLAELQRIAIDQFGGQVTRNMTTSLYVALRVGRAADT
jgi:hypothetical protein